MGRGLRDQAIGGNFNEAHGGIGMPGGVFISYRREDSGGFAGRIYDRLADRLGHESVFFDVQHSVRPRFDAPSVPIVFRLERAGLRNAEVF